MVFSKNTTRKMRLKNMFDEIGIANSTTFDRSIVSKIVMSLPYRGIESDDVLSQVKLRSVERQFISTYWLSETL